MKELKFEGTIYLPMKEGETKEEALERLFEIFMKEELDCLSSYGCYDAEVQEIETY